jgi:uncharacterized protein YeaO (DUF488 family)
VPPSPSTDVVDRTVETQEPRRARPVSRTWLTAGECVAPEQQQTRRTMMTTRHIVRIRRVYDDPSPRDGTRVLVDRLWPRGVSKASAHLDEWCKQIAPSTELRQWYNHDPELFDEFARRYRAELNEPERAEALAHLRELADENDLTLLTGTKNPDISEAAVLTELLATAGRPPEQ